VSIFDPTPAAPAPTSRIGTNSEAASLEEIEAIDDGVLWRLVRRQPSANGFVLAAALR
jgi:hypothetical protein